METQRGDGATWGPQGSWSLWGQSPPLWATHNFSAVTPRMMNRYRSQRACGVGGVTERGQWGPYCVPPQQNTPSTTFSRPYIEGDSQGQQPGREDTEDPIEVVEEAPVQPAVGVAPDEVAPLGAVVLPNLPALRSRGEGAWPGPPSTHRPPRGLPRPSRGDTATPRGHCHPPPPQALPSLSALPRFPHLSHTCVGRGLCQGQQRWKALSPPHPCPHTAHTHPGPWEGAGLASREVFGGKSSSGGNPGEIPAAMAGTWKQGRDGTPAPRQHPNPSRHPPQTPPQPPDLHPGPVRGSEHPRPEGACAPRPAAAGSRLAVPRPARAPRPAPWPPAPWCPVPGGDSPGGHLPPAAVPGGGERGLPPEPHPALPGRGQEGLKINNKIRNYS